MWPACEDKAVREDILTIDIATPDEVKARTLAAFAGRAAATARYSFSTAEDMARILTPSRWRVISAMTGAGPLGIRELARRVERDVKGVHNDASALVACGLVERTDDGKYLFPYDRVKVTFEVRTAA